MRTKTTAIATLAAVMVAGCSSSTGSTAQHAISTGPATSSATTTVTDQTSPAAGAPSACTELGGTLGSENTCEIHTESPGYTVDIRFPIDYPEQQSLTDFLTQHRDGFVDWVAEATPAFVSL